MKQGIGPHWESHTRDAQAEDVAFLMASGLTLAEACERVGVPVVTFRQRSNRHDKDQPRG